MTLSPDNVDVAREAVLQRGELAITLTASDGYSPHALKDVATAFKAMDGMLRAVAKSLDPAVPVCPVLVRVDIIDKDLRFVIRADPARPRRRRRKAA